MEGQAEYFSLNVPEHWRRRGFGRNLETGEDGVTLRSGEKYAVLDTIGLDELEGIGDIAAFAVGPHGNLVLLDREGNLWTYDRIGRHHERLFVPGHGLFSTSAALSVSGDTLFVADREGPGGEALLAAFDTGSGQLRWRRSGEEIDGIPFDPLALASDARHFYVLTGTPPAVREETDASGSLETLPLRILVFTLSGGLEKVIEDERFGRRASAASDRQGGSAFLAVSTSGAIQAFDGIERLLYSFERNGAMAGRIAFPPLDYAGLAADSAGNAYVGDSRVIGEGAEDDRFILRFAEEGRDPERISGFRGKTDGLAIDYRDRMYIWDDENRTVTVLQLQARTRLWEETGTPEGVWLSKAFDSAEAETVWHKFTIDADIPDGTMVRVSWFSSDSERMLIRGSLWKVDEWIAHSGHTFREKIEGLAAHWSPPVVNPKDALFFKTRGRYLWLKVEWIGSEAQAPLIRRMRVHFPRVTLLEHLPAVYREESGSSQDFLERYLALFGTLFDSVEERIDGMAEHFDRERVQGRQLRWLASWLGLSCDENWSDEWVRKLMRAAPELYRYRGTRHGIETLVESLTGRKPIIVEPFQFGAMREHGELKGLTDDLYSGDPYTFTLMLSQDQARTDKERVLLKELVEDHKPAYTEVKIMWLQPWMYLDLHTYLGVNTTLAEPSLLSLHPDRSMPNDTLIVDSAMDRRMDAHTRLGMDSELE